MTEQPPTLDNQLLATAYHSDVSLDEGVLTITATGAVGKAALGSPVRIIPLSSITALEFRAAKMLTNGQLRLVTDEGMTIVHFLKKHEAAITLVVAELQRRIQHPVGETAKAPLSSDARVRATASRDAYEKLRAERTARLESLSKDMHDQWTAAALARKQFLRELESRLSQTKLVDSESEAPVAAARLQLYIDSLTTEDQPDSGDEVIDDIYDMEMDESGLISDEEMDASPPVVSAVLASPADPSKRDIAAREAERLLGLALEKAKAGERLGAENAIRAAIGVTRRGGGRKAVEALERQIKSLEDSGELRIGSIGNEEMDASPLVDPSKRGIATREAERLLGLALEKAKAGEPIGEENAIRAAIGVTRRGGGRKAVKALERQIKSLEDSGELRIGSRFIGVVKAESGFSQFGRKGSIWSIQSGAKAVIIRSDRITAGGRTRAIDRFTSAQVFLDGQMQITQRPSLITMALLSPLPGTALIPGLALQKKEKNDSRTATLQISSAGWSISMPIPPDAISHPRQMAERINAAASEIEFKSEVTARGRSVAAAAISPQASAPIPQPDLKAQLDRLDSLAANGIITTDEAQQARLIIITK